ncbi:MAG: glycosyltransferase family 2 protein, partial [Micromonosporaceae bacterium]
MSATAHRTSTSTSPWAAPPPGTAGVATTEAPVAVRQDGAGTLRPDAAADVLDVTVVLPCYNEQDHVIAEVERITKTLDDTPYSYELLAIDDASTDRTREVLEEAAPSFPHLRVLAFDRNGGSGTARRIGTQQARGRVVVWTDADMSYPNYRIPEFVELLNADPGLDQVVGARTSEQGSHRLLRVPAKWLIRKIAEYLTNTQIPDLNSGLRAFRREAALP